MASYLLINIIILAFFCIQVNRARFFTRKTTNICHYRTFNNMTFFVPIYKIHIRQMCTQLKTLFSISQFSCDIFRNTDNHFCPTLTTLSRTYVTRAYKNMIHICTCCFYFLLLIYKTEKENSIFFKDSQSYKHNSFYIYFLWFLYTFSLYTVNIYF